MGASNTLVATLLAMAGQRNVITIPRAFVRFTGDLESAMLLNQLLYWMPRSHLDGDSIYKTDSDWQEELCLTRYAVRKARESLVKMGFLTTSVHHRKGTPAVHYHIDYETLIEKWEAWLQSNGVKYENELDSSPSKVRNRTLPDESSSKSNTVKSEIERGKVRNQTIIKEQRLHAENTSPPPAQPPISSGGGGDSYETEVRALLGGYNILGAAKVATKYAALDTRPPLDTIRASVLSMANSDPNTPNRIYRRLMDSAPPWPELRAAPKSAPLAATRPNIPDTTVAPSEMLRQLRERR